MSQRQVIATTSTVLLVVFIGCAALWFAWNIAEILVLLFISAILAAGFLPWSTLWNDGRSSEA